VSERLLTTLQVSELLGFCPETVLRWNRRGDLPGYRMPGGELRYRESEIEQWLEARATGADTRGGVSQPSGRARHRRGYAPAATLVGSANPPPDEAA
jgi:excisionase family DNA binding protein